MDLLQAVALFAAAMIAGALNSVAGGGSFISFPVLLGARFPGIDEITASATNTVALWPGAVASVGAYRNELKAQRVLLYWLSASSLVGGILGAEILKRTPKTTFEVLLPFLLLFATLLFTFSPRITAYFKARGQRQSQVAGSQADSSATTTADSMANPQSLTTRVVAVVLQLFVAMYGGFFGAGIGIMMLAILGIWGMTHIHEMNAVKTFQASIINGAAAFWVIVRGLVIWQPALIMLVGAIIGGYFGAFYARQIDPKLVRRFVIIIAFGLTIYFFFKTFVLPKG